MEKTGKEFIPWRKLYLGGFVQGDRGTASLGRLVLLTLPYKFAVCTDAPCDTRVSIKLVRNLAPRLAALV